MKIPGNKWNFDAELVLFFCWKLFQCECLFHYKFSLGFNSFRLFTALSHFEFGEQDNWNLCQMKHIFIVELALVFLKG